MGKRQVGELQLSELVTTFMLSELAINPIQDTSIPIFYSLIPLVFLLAAEVIMSFVMTKSPFMKKMLFGSPSIIIQHGILNQKELSRLRISISELLGELRLKDVSDINDVDYAILEQNGKLSVFLKKDKITLEKESDGIAHSIVIDGDINESNLKYAKKSREWIFDQLSLRSIDIKDVFLMTVDDGENINIIIKEEK